MSRRQKELWSARLGSVDDKGEQTQAGIKMRPKVFVSYSRKDTAFAEHLVADLAAEGFEAFLDTKAIGPGEPWQDRLRSLIIKADAIAFVLSPDSVDPKSVCDWELNEAERLQKRIIPVVCRSVPDADVPGRLHRLNYVFLTHERVRAVELAKLVDGLKVDIRWIRQHTEIGEDAERWANPATGGDHVLLQGKDISDAELWISSRPVDAPEPTETQRKFIKASREADIARIAKEKRQIKRTRSFQRAAGVLLALGVTGVVWQDIETTKREQAVFLDPVTKALDERHFERAIRFGLAAYPKRGDWPWTPLADTLRDSLGGALMQSRLQLATGKGGDARFSPDGKRILAALSDKHVRLLDAETGSLVTTLSGHLELVNIAEFNSDATRIVTASWDKTVRVWDAATGKQIWAHERLCPTADSGSLLDCQVRVATFSSDGKTVFVSAGPLGLGESTNPPIAQIVDTATGHQTPFADEVPTITSAAFSGDGRWLVTSGNGTWLRDGITGAKIAHLSGHRHRKLSFSPDGKQIAGARDKYLDPGEDDVLLWDASSGQEIGKLSAPQGETFDIAFSHDGQRLATGGDDNLVHVWNIATLQEERLLRGHDGAITRLEFSKDGARLVSRGTDGVARLWDVAAERVIVALDHVEDVLNARFSPNSERLVTASIDGGISIWDARHMTASINIPPPCVASKTNDRCAVNHAAFSGDGKLLIAAADDGHARVYDARTGAEVRKLTGHEEKLRRAALSLDGSLAVTTSDDRTTRVWDTAHGRELKKLGGPELWVGSASFSTDGTKVVTANWDHTLRVFSVSDGKELKVLQGDHVFVDAQFNHNDDTIVATAMDAKVSLWEVASGRRLATVDGKTGPLFGSNFNAQGNKIVTITDDNRARIWAAPGGQQVVGLPHSSMIMAAAFGSRDRVITTTSQVHVWNTQREAFALETPVDSVRHAFFSPDGSQLAAVFKDGTIRIWDARFLDLESVKTSAYACDARLMAAREYTKEEMKNFLLDALDPEDATARNPCLRRGPLHWEYYAQAAVRWSNWLISLWPERNGT